FAELAAIDVSTTVASMYSSACPAPPVKLPAATERGISRTSLPITRMRRPPTSAMMPRTVNSVAVSAGPTRYVTDRTARVLAGSAEPRSLLGISLTDRHDSGQGVAKTPIFQRQGPVSKESEVGQVVAV